MDCNDIALILDTLKTNKRGHIRGKNRAVDKIHSKHLTDVDNKLTDVRVFVAKLSTGHSAKDALKMIDDFIYKMQVK